MYAIFRIPFVGKCRQKLVGFSKPLAFSTSSRKDLTQLVVQVDNRLFFCGDNLSVNDKRRLVQNKITLYFEGTHRICKHIVPHGDLCIMLKLLREPAKNSLTRGAVRSKSISCRIYKKNVHKNVFFVEGSQAFG